jgi:nitrite reductase (NADH) small subunit
VAKWTRIADVSDCPRGTSIECLAGECLVALFNVDGEYYALDGVCPHQGGPLAKGCLDGPTVACPWHGWQFDVVSGQHKTSRTVMQRAFPVRIDGSDVLIDLEGHR